MYGVDCYSDYERRRTRDHRCLDFKVSFLYAVGSSKLRKVPSSLKRNADAVNREGTYLCTVIRISARSYTGLVHYVPLQAGRSPPLDQDPPRLTTSALRR